MAQASLQLASPATAKTFVETIDVIGVTLPGGTSQVETEAPGVAAPSVAEPVTGIDGLKTEQGIAQTYLVGSQIVSFDKDVTDDRRRAALNSSLLATLVATKLQPDHGSPDGAAAWHAAYVNTLVQIGWLPQGAVTVDQTSGAAGATVDKVILEIAGTLLGGGTALALATKVLTSLKDLDKSDPFITLYNSRTIKQNTVDFGLTLAAGTGAGFLVSAIEYDMTISVDHEQVLFFTWDSTDAKLAYRRFDLSLDDAVYASVQPTVEEKLKEFAAKFVSKLDL